MTARTLFGEALSRPAAERAAFLDAACAGQPELRAAVESLLAAHEAAGSFLDKPAVQLGQTVDSAPRLRRAELAQAEARAKAAQEVKRRRVTLALAATVLLAVVLGGGDAGERARRYFSWIAADSLRHLAASSSFPSSS